jgi:4-hydroxy-4-methyl-2-oxoglutarate aldolase
MIPSLTDTQLAEFEKLGTCAVANAIETFGVRLRNEGFTDASIRCLIPRPKPMMGYAMTARIKCSNPPKDGHAYVDRTDWWNYAQSISAPRVVVIQDVDEKPGTGSLVGEVHAGILMALGCSGVVTNGAVRDVPALEKAGFHVFAGSLAVSHAYAHIVEFGKPVEVGGLAVKPGDLLHADMHGVLSVPEGIAAQIPAAAAKIAERESRVLAICRSGNLSLDELRAAVKDVNH